jgi:hypothetical protein
MRPTRRRIPRRAFPEQFESISFVTDEPARELVEQASDENVCRKIALGRRSAFDRFAKERRLSIDDRDNFDASARTVRHVVMPAFHARKNCVDQLLVHIPLASLAGCAACNFSTSSKLQLRIHR